jgi:hypothetical protein
MDPIIILIILLALYSIYSYFYSKSVTRIVSPLFLIFIIFLYRQKSQEQIAPQYEKISLNSVKEIVENSKL